MGTFVVERTYVGDRSARAGWVPQHRAYLEELIERGVLLAAGPVVGVNGGLLVYRAADRSDLDDVLAADPFTLAGLVASVRVLDWNPTTGIWAAKGVH